MQTDSIVYLGILLLVVVGAGAGIVIFTGVGPSSPGGNSTQTAPPSTQAPQPQTPSSTPVGTTPPPTMEPTLTPTPASQTPVPTLTPTAEPTPTRTPQKTVTDVTPQESFDEEAVNTSLVEDQVEDEILDYRTENGVSNRHLFHDRSPTYNTLKKMLRDHSGTMASTGNVSFTPNGLSVVDWYKKYQLSRLCRFKHEAHIETPERGQLMLVGHVTTMSENETNIGKMLYEDLHERNWFPDRKMTFKNATYLSVGVTVEDDGEIYASFSTC